MLKQSKLRELCDKWSDKAADAIIAADDKPNEAATLRAKAETLVGCAAELRKAAASAEE